MFRIPKDWCGRCLGGEPIGLNSFFMDLQEQQRQLKAQKQMVDRESQTARSMQLEAKRKIQECDLLHFEINCFCCLERRVNFCLLVLIIRIILYILYIILSYIYYININVFIFIFNSLERNCLFAMLSFFYMCRMFEARKQLVYYLQYPQNGLSQSILELNIFYITILYTLFRNKSSITYYHLSAKFIYAH